jgi:hypothetical protein
MTRDRLISSPPLQPVAIPSPERLRFLARRVHKLGDRPLYELLAEVADGADLWGALERYARLAPYAAFIREHGGDRLIITGTRGAKPKASGTADTAGGPSPPNDFYSDDLPF